MRCTLDDQRDGFERALREAYLLVAEATNRALRAERRSRVFAHRADEMRAEVEKHRGAVPAYEKLEKELGEERGSAELLRRELDPLRAKVATLESEIESRKSDEALLRSENEKLTAEVMRLTKQPNALLAGCATTINKILIDWPRAGDKPSKKALSELRDRCEKWGKGETA